MKKKHKKEKRFYSPETPFPYSSMNDEEDDVDESAFNKLSLPEGKDRIPKVPKHHRSEWPNDELDEMDLDTNYFHYYPLHSKYHP